jgi:hypothetical protein
MIVSIFLSKVFHQLHSPIIYMFRFVMGNSFKLSQSPSNFSSLNKFSHTIDMVF